MELTHRTGLIRAGLIAAAFLLLTVSFRLEAAERDRISETRARIEDLVKECRAALKADRDPPIDELRAELESLATDTQGLKVLARYQDHRVDYVAILAVRAIAGAPDEVGLYAGKLLAARVDLRHLTPKRRLVYIETVKALGETGYLGGGKAMLKVLERTKDLAVSHAIIEALGRLDDSRAVRKLFARLGSRTSGSVRVSGLKSATTGIGGASMGSKLHGDREQNGMPGAPVGSSVGAGGTVILGEDVQEVDEKKVVNLVYDVLSKLLGAEFVSWKAVDDFLRGHRSDLKEAEGSVEKKAREQDREISRLLK